MERDNCESLEKLSKGEKKRVGVEFDKWTRLSILSSNQVSSRSTVVSCNVYRVTFWIRITGDRPVNGTIRVHGN